ncbi:MAG TPA: TonB-dependent receptor, partial [Sphingomicrobium sp.]|nr:TonB-dependent receptor [Sphingomicrobium sp.]
MASTILLGSGAAYAQETPPAEPTTDPALPQAPAAAPRQPVEEGDEIVVTATKRAENLQDVPIAITAFGTKTLEDNQVQQFDDYAKMIPSLSVQSGGPGFSNVYFRGVASGENANHSASLPSVGTYLDEQPITTITGALDLHIFDVERIEALAGPQGTLYGASSQAGTIRIITNKPDTSGTYGEIGVEANKVAHGDWGYTAEGFLNHPLSERIAARVVAWYRRDGGYIDNIPGTRSYREHAPAVDGGAPTGNFIVISNDDPDQPEHNVAEDNYNDVYTYGARAALRIELNDNWTVTPQIMGQSQTGYGSFAEESGLDDLEIQQWWYEKTKDKWWQAALTVEGKIGNFDMTYAGAYMKRQIDGEFDYSDYSYFYNELAGYGAYWYDNDYNPIDPTQYIVSDDSFTKQSHELRFTSPADKRLRVVGGLFWQRQTHNIEQNYIIDDLVDFYVVPGTESNIWLTKQFRVDRDKAIFGEVTFDVTPQLSLTAGGRYYWYKNSLEGFFGYSASYSSRTGVAACFREDAIDGAPCTNLDKTTKGNGFVHRLNATWKPNEDLLFYATWSRGFRPGGINRRGTLPPYDPDYLTNYEAGAKISFGRGSHFNFAIYQENWKDIQLSFLGANGLTEIRNAGDARIRGFEADLLLRPMTGLSWSTGVSYNDAKLRNDFCLIAVPNFDCSIDVDLDVPPDGELEENATLAEKGARLPITAKWKMNSRLRYDWNLSSDMKAHVQAAVSYEGKRRSDLRDLENGIVGNLKAYTLVDTAAGIEKGPWSVDLYVKNLFDVRGQITKGVQCLETVCGDPDGVTAEGPKIYTVV